MKLLILLLTLTLSTFHLAMAADGQEEKPKCDKSKSETDGHWHSGDDNTKICNEGTQDSTSSFGEAISNRTTQAAEYMQKKINSAGTSDEAGYGSGSIQIPLSKKGGTSYDFCHRLIKDSSTVSADQSLGDLIKTSLKQSNSKIKFGLDPEKEYTTREARQIIESTLSSGSKAVECAAILVIMKNSAPLNDANEFGQANSQKSMDGLITCESDGLTSIDYPACSNAITAYNSFYLGQQALAAYQNIDLQKTNIEEQSKVNASDAASALNAQQASIDKQSSQMKEQAMTQAAKAATLFQMIRLMPTTNSIAKKCGKETNLSIIQDVQTKIKQAVNETLARIKLSSEVEKGNAEKLAQEYGFKYVPCEGAHGGEVSCDQTSANDQKKNFIKLEPAGITINNEGNWLSGDLNQQVCYDVALKNNVAQNTKAIDQLKGVLAQSGIAVATNLMMAGMLDDRSDQIDDLKNKLNNYDPSANGFSFLPAELAKFCEENPTDSRCAAGLPQGASRFGTAGMNIQFGDAGGATTFDQGTLDQGNDWTPENSATNSTLGSDISPRFATQANKGGGFAGAGIGAAAIKTGAVNKGGGGGGSAPGGVAAPSGGNIQSPGAQGSYGDYKPKIKQPSYSGGANKLTYSSAARNLKNKKKSSSSNPFSKMFAKKKNSQNMNFRGLASKQIPKGGSIFQRISRRYQIVNDKKKLITYEVVE